MKKRLLIVLMLLLLTSVAASVHAQAIIPAYATAEDGVLTIYDSGGTPHEVISSNRIPATAWNADGSILAFLVTDFEFQTRLGVVDTSTYEATILETAPLVSGFNVSWTTDGRILYAAVNPANDPSAGITLQTDITVIAPQAGATPQVLGTYGQGVGCGGGSNIPADWAYWDETAGFGGFFLTLAETPYGIVHSTDCSNSSLSLLDISTGRSTPIAANFAKVVVSPDGSKLAGVEINYQDRPASRLMLMNLADFESSFVPTVNEPDQIVWSQDATALYYSTRTVTANIIDNLTELQHTALNQMFGGEIADLSAYTAAIHHVDLTSGHDTQIYTADAYAIGRMVETTGAFYFSEVPNLYNWVNALLADEIRFEDFEGAPAYVEPYVMRLDVEDSPEAAFLGWFGQFTPVVQ